MSDARRGGREPGGFAAEREPSFGATEREPPPPSSQAEAGISLGDDPRPYRASRGSARRRSRRRRWPWLMLLVLVAAGLGYAGYLGYHSYMQGHVSLDQLASLGKDAPTAGAAFVTPAQGAEELTEANLRWCLRQQLRLDTLDKLVTSNLEIARINLMREDMAALCDLELADDALVAAVVVQLEQLRESIVAETIDNQLLYIGSVEGSKWTASQLVSETQRLLDSLGYRTGPIDGKLGRKTMIAIKAFQRDFALEPTGQPSEELLARLRKAIQEKRGAS